eukprot:3234978-Prymnesium_polylepis.3
MCKVSTIKHTKTHAGSRRRSHPQGTASSRLRWACHMSAAHSGTWPLARRAHPMRLRRPAGCPHTLLADRTSLAYHPWSQRVLDRRSRRSIA